LVGDQDRQAEKIKEDPGSPRLVQAKANTKDPLEHIVTLYCIYCILKSVEN
jgi:hypothetical protein